jgi:hypothetical protein
MFDQPFSQRIKARSGPGGIFLIQAGLIENLPLFHVAGIKKDAIKNSLFQ